MKRSISTFFIACILLATWSQPVAAQTIRPRPKFTIGKATTHILEPRDEDGYIDYVAALNDHLSKGVTPASNACVLLWQAFGPHPEGVTMPAEFFTRLGIKSPPEKGDYFIPLASYLQGHRKTETEPPGREIDELLDRVTRRPWTVKQFPEIAGWLKANEKPLALVVAATKRSEYYSPLVPQKTAWGRSSFHDALIPGPVRSRDFAHALLARALLRVGESRSSAAWPDILACHRLGRFIARGGTLIENLIGLGIGYAAREGTLVFLDIPGTQAEQLRSWLKELQALPPQPLPADAVDTGERLIVLDTIMLVDRYGPDVLHTKKGAAPQVKPLTGQIDWDLALSNTNQRYDRLVAALRHQERGSREKQLTQLEEELKQLRKTSMSMPAFLSTFFGNPRERGRKIGDVLLTMLTPSVQAVQQAADRSEQQQRNLQLAFALASYQREHQRYPPNLAVLAPKYLPRIPDDLFSGKALMYRPTERGYLLYSVGVNGQDDQGRGEEDIPVGDDLRVRLPMTVEKR